MKKPSTRALDVISPGELTPLRPTIHILTSDDEEPQVIQAETRIQDFFHYDGRNEVCDDERILDASDEGGPGRSLEGTPAG